MDLKKLEKLNEDEDELFDLILSVGLGEIVSIAREKFSEEKDIDTFLSLLVEIQNLFEKLGYEFNFKIKEIKELWNVEENSNLKKL